MSTVDVIMPSHEPNKLWYEESTKSIPYDENVRLFVVNSKGFSNPPSYDAIYEQINFGFENSKSKYVLVFGSDDIMYDGMLQQLINEAERKDAAVVYCDYEMMDEKGDHIRYVPIKAKYDFGLNCTASHYPDVSLFRRDIVEEFGGWDVTKGRYAMWWLWLQIGRKYGQRIFHVPYFGFRYRQHQGGMHNRESTDARNRFTSFISEWLGHVPVVGR